MMTIRAMLSLLGLLDLNLYFRDRIYLGQAEMGSPVRDLRVTQSTVRAASDIGAEIVLTV